MVRLGLLAVLLLLSPPLRLAAGSPAEAISWMQADLPPQSIIDGELAGQGWSDQQMRALFPLLPGFDHRIVQGSLGRIWYDMAHRDGVCFNGAARNAERESFAVFSHRPILVPSYRVIIRAEETGRFTGFLDSRGAIDLDRLAEQTGLAGGYTAGREHFPAINRFLQNPKRHTRLEKAVSTSQLFNLLHGGRLDFIISSPVEAPYYKARFHLEGAFASLPIRDDAASIKGYVACSKGPLGRAVIARIDALLDDNARWAAYLEPLGRWMEPKDFADALAQKPEETPVTQ